MCKNSVFLPALFLTFGSSAAMAQDYPVDDYYPNTFVGVQAGAQITFGKYDAMKLLTPQFGFQLGHWMSPEIGARLSIQGYEYKGGFRMGDYQLKSDEPYKFNGFVGSMDMLFNLSNICYPNRSSQQWNLLFIAGFGVNGTWGHAEYKDIVARINDRTVSNTRLNNFSFNGRAGIAGEYNITPHLGVNLEVDVNTKGDNFNLRPDDNSTLQMAAFAGVSYKFGNHVTTRKAAPADNVATSQADYEAEMAAAKAEAERKAAEAEKARVLAAQRKAQEEAAATARAAKLAEPLGDVNLHYDLRGTDPKDASAIKKVAQWMQDHPEKRIIVNGYADRGTGNPRINMRYSQMRADKVADALKASGVPADQISVKAWGDTVQPYAENDRNRCVIVVEK